MQPEARTNRSAVTEFILLGLVDTENLQPLVFVLFLFAYLVTVGGNLSILAAILVEPKLHTPMYFFLGNLSALDIGCITVTVPAMLGRLLSHKRTVPYAACSFPGENARSWEALGEARPGQSSLSAGALALSRLGAELELRRSGSSLGPSQ